MLSIVMSVHNKRHYIAELIEALRTTAPEAELVLVDDGSTDDSGEILRQHADVFVRTEDVWETLANNAGLAAASGSYVAIVQDDDKILNEGWLSRSAEAMERHRFGILGGRGIGHLYYRSRPRLPRPRRAPLLTTKGQVLWAHRHRFEPPDVWSLEVGLGPRPLLSSIVEVDVTIRSPFIISRELMTRIGPLDERYAPLGYDDHAYCMAARRAGFRVGITSIPREPRFQGGSDWLYQDPEKKAFFERSFAKNKAMFLRDFVGDMPRRRPRVIAQDR